MILYGIPNCDSVKKARKWLEQHKASYRFHDFRKDGLSAPLLKGWVKQVGVDTLLNRRGTTWRQLDEQHKQNLDEQSAIALLLAHPTLIKRPVLVKGNSVLVGFDKDGWQSLL